MNYVASTFDNWHTHDFGYAYIDTYDHFFPIIL